MNIFELDKLEKENEKLKKALDKAIDLLNQIECPVAVNCNRKCNECWKAWLMEDE